jgi:hypothetical protein
MCTDWTNLIDFMKKKVGVDLSDHYRAVQNICQNLNKEEEQIQ